LPKKTYSSQGFVDTKKTLSMTDGGMDGAEYDNQMVIVRVRVRVKEIVHCDLCLWWYICFSSSASPTETKRDEEQDDGRGSDENDRQ